MRKNPQRDSSTAWRPSQNRDESKSLAATSLRMTVGSCCDDRGSSHATKACGAPTAKSFEQKKSQAYREAPIIQGRLRWSCGRVAHRITDLTRWSGGRAEVYSDFSPSSNGDGWVPHPFVSKGAGFDLVCLVPRRRPGSAHARPGNATNCTMATTNVTKCRSPRP